jgi:hypothetical protein
MAPSQIWLMNSERVALVSPEDYCFFARWTWMAGQGLGSGPDGFPGRVIRSGLAPGLVRLDVCVLERKFHRFLRATERVRHIDQDWFNCTRENLEAVPFVPASQLVLPLGRRDVVGGVVLG